MRRSYRNVTYNGPDYAREVKAIIRQFLPRAGEMIEQRARRKLGRYQPGWPQLAPATLRRKARYWGKRGKRLAATGLHLPLIRSGRMARSGRHWERGDATHIIFDFPAQQHEQNVAEGIPAASAPMIPPARPFIIPALEETLDPIVDELETLVARLI